MARRIRNRPRNENDEIVLEFPSSVAVGAFASILKYLVSTDADRADAIEINRVNQFELFTAASTLGAEGALPRIQKFIISNLTPPRFFSALSGCRAVR